MRRSAFAFLVVCALSGCAVGPDYKRPEVQITPSYKEAGEWKAAQPQDDLDHGK